MKCIIIDDEPLAREGIKILVTHFPDLQLEKQFGNIVDAREYIAHHEVDLIFLDIELSGDNGLDFARSLPEKIMVIFTTAYPDYAAESYEVEAIDYLLKPVSRERFEKAILRAQQSSRMLSALKNSVERIGDNYLIIKADGKFHKLMHDDIQFIVGLKDYVVIHTLHEKYLTGMNLKNIHNKLPLTRFMRVSKSYVVNKDKVTSFDYNTIYIKDHEIPIGKMYQKEFFDLFFK
ncbi:LytR/AlgR family response regulator transcription factor [Chitinophaga rhizophila]|uniref:LytTR family DNA-binding domain-containing protein n=1 Tax=Chitinophaga rhizophila TaxID=2866212 RepID=A0ABS7G5D4_9BACT|nr:LytTR family DNA-binding domain-containing protein [Chitinophaga rhizophila]MBW8682864.1 LytTR family DNA-binding domain-containing protein [Chitinophaga rhizophila]